MPDTTYLKDTKLITAILPKGRSRPLQEALVEQKGIHTGQFHYGRGVGRDSHIRDRGIGEQQEREIFEVIVTQELAEEVFQFIFDQARMDEPHGGMMYMASLPRSTIMTMPDIPEEED